MSRHPVIIAFLVIITASACNRPATGPLKGVLIVSDSALDDDTVLDVIENTQLYLTTVDVESVFDFSTCSFDEFDSDLKTRRTILFVADSEEKLPDELQEDSQSIYYGSDIWAEGQSVFGIVVPGFENFSILSSRLEDAYNGHLRNWIYTSFVATQMSSPARIDSLTGYCGFSIDVPKSWRTSDWNPDGGFIQFQR